jgi:hypothetical protein
MEPVARHPVNERFAAYLDQLRAPLRRGGWFAAFGIGSVVAGASAGIAVALWYGLTWAWSLIPVLLFLALRGVDSMKQRAKARERIEQVRTVADGGLPVQAYVVRSDAWSGDVPPGADTIPCLVLFSFQTEVGEDAEYMRYLAERVQTMQGTYQEDVERRYIAALAEGAPVRYRRRRLPYSFTDGSIVYCADLWVKRAYLRGGSLRRGPLSCLAEPGEIGGIELVPAWLLTEEATERGQSPALG